VTPGFFACHRPPVFGLEGQIYNFSLSDLLKQLDT
jgi:hypothetical protein